MVTGSGRGRILDFGLASAEGSATLTRTGSQLGSVPYMAPEAIRGDVSAIDARTDVYGLGVTLYEMLTLRSPHGADTIEGTRGRILAGQPIPVQKLNAAVPWDAETVCLTAMDPDPDHRYRSMTALCEDMRRFLDRQPIHARRPGSLLRLRRWAQRSPARAVASVLALLLVVGGPIVYALVQRSVSEELRGAYHDEEQERIRAEESLDAAIAAIDEMLHQGSDWELARHPGTDPARQSLLIRALELYEKLLAREGNEPLIIGRVIAAQLQVAFLQRELGRMPASVTAARRALELCEEALAGDGEGGLDPAHLKASRFRARFALLSALFSLDPQGEFPTACAELQAEPVPDDPVNAASQLRDKTIALQLLARTKQAVGDLRGALADLDRAAESCEAFLATNEGQVPLLSALAMVLQTRAYFSGFHVEDSPYPEMFERSAVLLEQALESSPESPGLRNQLGWIFSDWAHVEIVRENFEEARAHAEFADSVLATLAEEFPLRETYCAGHLSNLQRLSWACRKSGDLEEAEAVLRDGIRFGTEATERLPDTTDIRFYVAMMSTELARHHSQRSELDEADELLELGQGLWRELLSHPEPAIGVQRQAGAFYDNLARHQVRRGDLEDALASARTAIEWHERMLARVGTQEHAIRLGHSLPLLATVAVRLDRHDDAVDALRKGLEGGFVTREQAQEAELAEALADRADYQQLIGEGQ